MPEITFIHPDGAQETIKANENQSIMQAATAHKVKGIDGICGGCIGCASCHIIIPKEWESRVTSQDNEQSEEEIDMLETAKNTNNYSRLGCQIKLTNALNGLKIYLPKP